MTVVTKPIPFVNLAREHAALKKELTKAFHRLLDSSNFILGKEVEQFEHEFAAFLGVKHVCGVASGTDALILALRAIGVGPGDEVIVPAFTFVATAIAVQLVGARPVFVDITHTDFTIDPKLVKRAISPATKAIIPVHLYGYPAAMAEICKLARQHHLYVIEDAAQAHGARIGKKMVGTIGDIGCFSFYPSKNLGALGDGGAIVTNNAKLDSSVRLMRNYGERTKYIHDSFGTNSRLDALQASFLRIKLPHLETWNATRAGLAKRYNHGLRTLSNITTPPIDLGKAIHPVFHLFVMRAKQRNALLNWLHKHKIAAQIHYPRALHQQKIFSSLGYKAGDFPVAEEVAQTAISLPMSPYLRRSEVDMVIRTIQLFFTSN